MDRVLRFDNRYGMVPPFGGMRSGGRGWHRTATPSC